MDEKEKIRENETPGKKNEENSRIKELFSWIIVIVAAILLGLFINNFVLLKAEIPSSSMENTLKIDDQLIGLRSAYWFHKPERGDIVMFDYPDDEKQLFIKRIIGLPGETVEIVEGKVYINGSSTPLDEPYVKETPVGSFGPYVVPEGKYFMLGDNRNNSKDSRYWKNQFVEEDKIHCKAWLRYKPNLTFVK